MELTIVINFVSSKDNDEERAMHSKSDNIEFMIYDNADKDTKDLFESLLNKYQIGLETSMRDSGFISDCVRLLHYKSLKINPNQCGSCKESPDWIKNKKTTIDPIN